VAESVTDSRPSSRPPAEELLRALAAHPGGEELLTLGGQRGDLALVGGSVRDMLLGTRPRELDVVVAEDPSGLAHELARLLAESSPAGPSAPTETLHERFGTALVAWEGGRVDIATRRSESYPAPGALPDVRPGTAEEDLRRRDFTVNAIAAPLGGPGRGELEHVGGALEDLSRGLLRVLHERSFIDDPTRLLRLARYRVRLGFEIEPVTAALAAAAVSEGALGTVSPSRLGAELRLALAEPDAPATLALLDELGVLRALHPGIAFDEPLARGALALLPADGRVDSLLLAVLVAALAGLPGDRGRAAMFELLDRLEFPSSVRERAIRAATASPSLAAGLQRSQLPSELYDLLADEPAEAIAMAGALAVASDPEGAGRAGDWLGRLRHVRLQITGEDLLAAGIPAGPQVGERLAAALRRRLDGALEEGSAAELDAALEAGE